MLLEIPGYITVEALQDFARSQDHALRETEPGCYTMVPVPPIDNIKRPPKISLPTIGEAAAQLNTTGPRLRKILRHLGAIDHQSNPASHMTAAKLMHTSTRIRQNPRTGGSTPYQVTVVTPAGIEWIRKKIETTAQAPS